MNERTGHRLGGNNSKYIPYIGYLYIQRTFKQNNKKINNLIK